MYWLGCVLSSKTPPSLIGGLNSSATKTRSILASLEGARSSYSPTSNAYTSMVASNKWFMWMMLIAFTAAAMFYLFQPFEQRPEFIHSAKSLPAFFTSKDSSPEISSPPADAQQAVTGPSITQGREQKPVFDVVENTAAKIEDISDSRDDIQMAFVALENSSPKEKADTKAKTKPKTASKPKEASKAKTAAKASTQHTQKNVVETKANVKQGALAISDTKLVTSEKQDSEQIMESFEADDADVAVISAMLGHYMGVSDDGSTQAANNKSVKTLVEVSPADDLAPEEQSKKITVTAKAEPTIEVIEKDAQIKGAMDISMMANDPAAFELEKCSTKNFIQKSYCEWRACSDYRGKSPLCPSSGKEPENTAAELDQEMTFEKSSTKKSDIATDNTAGEATKELTDHVTQEAKTMATNKTKEKANSVIDKQLSSILGGK